MTDRTSTSAWGVRGWLRAGVLALLAWTSAQAQLPSAGAGQIRTVQQAMGETPATNADLTNLYPAGMTPAQAAQVQAQLQAQSQAQPQGKPAVPAPSRTPNSALVRAALGTSSTLSPYGARLFTQNDIPAALPLSDGQHVLAPGDDVRVMIWGGYNYDAALKVQKDGTIFLPFAGVLKLAGLREAELPEVVQRRVATVFTGNVRASAALLSANPVRVYVTGYANSPGIYEGYPGEGVYAFVKRAGGIDLQRGSFTQVQLLRGGNALATIDFYDLLANGRQPSVLLQSGDTIHVALRGPMVSVRGLVGVEAEFELGQPARTLGQIAELAGTDATANQVRIERVRDGARTAELISMRDDGWRGMPLQAGDAVQFGRTDHTESIYVRIQGEHAGASEMVLPRGATLADALARVSPSPWSRLSDSFVIREEIRQAQIIFKSVAARQIEQTILGARSASVDEARLRKEEADLLLDWVKRLESYDVRGSLVAADANPKGVFLISGDVIEIPSSRAPVFVVGEVFTPMAAQRVPEYTARDYLKLAGVDTERSELRYFLQSPSGVVRAGTTLDARPDPGDQLFVLPAVDNKRLQGSKDLLQIIYQLAVSSKIIFGL